MTTAYDIIKKAFQKGGILTKTEVPSADETQDALDTLNAMLSSWSNDSMMISARVLDDLTLTGGVGNYTIGTGGTLNTARPVTIIDAYITQTTTDYPLSIVTDEVFDLIPLKTALGLPKYINYSNDYPLGKIRIYPVPSASYVLHLRSEKVLSSFTLNQVVDLPAGWEQALIYNLAVMIAPEYNQPTDQIVKEIADNSKAAIQRSILKNRTMDAQAATVGKGNVYNGWFK